MEARLRRTLPTRFAAILPAALLLAACAQQPIPFSSAEPVSTANHFQGFQTYAQPSPGAAHVLIVRDPGVGDSPISAVLFINGIQIARFWTRQKIELYMPPAQYLMVIESGFSGFGEPEPLKVSLESGKIYGFRIKNERDGGFVLKPADRIN